MQLRGKIFDIHNLPQQSINRMFELMDMFYENTNFDVFMKDLNDKDKCIVLFDDNNTIQGFSTQKLIKLKVDNKDINGVFSGDTIIHKNFWGSLELYRAFGKEYIDFSNSDNEFYWFLISKGYKTYRILPTFFHKFYPNYSEETPTKIKKIMDIFGKKYYPEEYNSSSGVIEYKSVKDKLRPGVADITEGKLKNKHITFFKNINPNHAEGNDVICLTSLKSNNLKSMIKRLILDGE